MLSPLQSLEMATPLHNAPAVATGLAIGADSSGSSLCVLCADVERQVLNPLTKEESEQSEESEGVIVNHHGSFGLLVAAATGGCRLCCALKEGYLRSNVGDALLDKTELGALMDQTLLQLLRHDQSDHILQCEQEGEDPYGQWTLADMDDFWD